MAFGEGPRVTAFKGEQAITSAMMDLVEGKKNTLGYVLGHKEPPLAGNTPISVLKTFIENENIKFQELNLFDVGAIPPDLKAIVIAGPQYDFSDREMKLLREFWEKQGRLLLLLDPGAKTPKLDAFLSELGLKVNDDRLMVFLRDLITHARAGTGTCSQRSARAASSGGERLFRRDGLQHERSG